jgi:hypothetical protein
MTCSTSIIAFFCLILDLLASWRSENLFQSSTKPKPRTWIDNVHDKIAIGDTRGRGPCISIVLALSVKSTRAGLETTHPGPRNIHAARAKLFWFVTATRIFFPQSIVVDHDLDAIVGIWIGPVIRTRVVYFSLFLLGLAHGDGWHRNHDSRMHIH